jgi:hypothetical protein
MSTAAPLRSRRDRISALRPPTLPAPPARRPSSHPPDALPDEDVRHAEAREKDMLTFRLAGRRRTLSTLVIGLAMIAARFAGIVVIPWTVAIGILSLGIVVNEVAWRVATTPRLYRGWFRYFFATYDALLISTTIAAYGHPSMLVVYFLAIVPYSFDHGRALGYYTRAPAPSATWRACGRTAPRTPPRPSTGRG